MVETCMARRQAENVAEGRDGAEAPAGTQAIQRAFALLRGVARQEVPGAGLAELARAAGLSTATAHRILQALVQEGLIGREPATRRYRLRSGYFALADAAARTDLRARLRPVLIQAAAEFGESVYLSIPTGQDVLCIDRVTGEAPIRVVPFDIGSRRPLGVGAAGIALLAAETPERAAAIMGDHAASYRRYGLDVAVIAGMVAACRRQGHSYNPGRFIRGVSGVGLAVRDGAGQAVAAINVTAINPHLAKSADRRRIVTRLRALLGGAGYDPANFFRIS